MEGGRSVGRALTCTLLSCTDYRSIVDFPPINSALLLPRAHNDAGQYDALQHLPLPIVFEFGPRTYSLQPMANNRLVQSFFSGLFFHLHKAPNWSDLSLIPSFAPGIHDLMRGGRGP